MIPMQAKPAPVGEMFDFMAKTGLTLADLVEVGGADLKSANPRMAEKAKRTEKCWSLMAQLGVKYADLENSPRPPIQPAGRCSAPWKVCSKRLVNLPLVYGVSFLRS
jgi:hypothetical protein